MLNVTKELTALARKLGYTGNAPDTVAKAINAITASVGEGGGEGGGGCDCEPLVVPLVTLYQDKEDESKYYYYDMSTFDPENPEQELARIYLDDFYYTPLPIVNN